LPHPDQLELPLFVSTSGATGEELIDWSDQEISALREAILLDALRTILGFRGRVVWREEAWAWIEAEDPHPFSFRVCAQAVGADPDDLRVSFARLVARSSRACEADIARARQALIRYLEAPGDRQALSRAVRSA
jgi:hypothetical protein